MKKWLKNTIGVALYLIMIILGASVIGDLVDLIIKDKINKFLILGIKAVLVLVMLILLSKTKTVKSLEEEIFGKPKEENKKTKSS